MDLYLLDSLFRRTEIIDLYESVIWTERFSELGEFQLVIRSTVDIRRLLIVNTMMWTPDSTRVMKIDTVEAKTDDDGKKLLNVSGKALEGILMDRGSRDAMVNSTAEPAWVLTGTPGNIMRQIFQTTCVTGSINVGDKIPFYAVGNLYPADGIPEDPDSTTIAIAPGTVFDAIKTVGDSADLGFRFTRNDETNELYFNVYAGNDHTSGQFDLPVVVFSPTLGNLANITELKSSAALKNVAYVVAANGTAVVYAIGVDSTISGFDRRVMMIASDSDLPAGTALDFQLQAEGQQALAQQKNLVAFDGEIPKSGGYKYHTDYELGDLVEMRDEDGLYNFMRVTEQIFVSDNQGYRSYPTLSLNLIITPGSWFAVYPRLVWSDADGTWIEQE